jgi:hypothetical protein
MQDNLLPKNQFYVVRELPRNGKNFCGSVNSVDISLESEPDTCKLNRENKQMISAASYHDMPAIVSCKDSEKFEERAKCAIRLDGGAIDVSDTRTGFIVGSMYDARLSINNKEIRNFWVRRLACGSYGAVVDLAHDSHEIPVIAGFDPDEMRFLGNYEYAARSYRQKHSDARYSIEEFVWLLNSFSREKKNKPSLKKVEINSRIQKSTVLCADAVVSNGPKERYAMIPSHSILLASLFERDVFLDDRLLKEI